jgi:iron complex transport system substrate-binding protein
MRRAALITAALSGTLALTACGGDAGTPATGADGGPTVTVTDASGAQVEVPADPGVVVTTDWSVARTLNDLGVELDGVPAATAGLPEDMAALAEVPSVGSVREPDFEAISALEPDLVIIAGRSGTPEVLAEMQKITPNVVDMSVRWEDPVDQLPTIAERVVDLGRIFGEEEQAQEQVDEVLADVEEIAGQAGDTSAMFVQVSGGTVSAYGPGSRFGVVYEDFGFADTGAPVDTENEHGQEISQEFFTQYNPDVLLVLDRSQAIGEEAQGALDVLDNGLVDTTTAAEEDRIVQVDGFSWYIANNAPASLARMVEDVTNVL